MKKGWIVVVLFLWLIMASAPSIYGAAVASGSAPASSQAPVSQPQQQPQAVEPNPPADATQKSADSLPATKTLQEAATPEAAAEEFKKTADAAKPSLEDINGLVADKIVDTKRAAREELLAKSNVSLVDQLKEQLAKIKESFKKMFTIGAQIPDAYKAASYFADSSVKVSQPDSGSLVINFGYAGAGDVTTGFLGGKSRLNIPFVPDFLVSPVMTAFAKFSQSVGVNRFIIITPSDECVSKLILLGCSKASKKVSESEFIKEFHLLLARLYKTPSAKGLKSLSETMPSVLKELAQELEVAGQSLSDLFVWYGPEFEKMLNNDFSKAPVLVPEDHSAVINYALTILLRSTLDYRVQKAAYLKSPEGKTASDLLEKNLVTLGTNDKTTAYASFNSPMPGFTKIKQDVISRLAPFMKTPFFIKLKVKITAVIYSFVEELGITQSDFESFSGANIALAISDTTIDGLLDKTGEELVFAHAGSGDGEEGSADGDDQGADADSSTSDPESAGDDAEDDSSQDASESTGDEAADATAEEVAADDAPVEGEEAVVVDGADATAEEIAADDAPVVDDTATVDGADATPEEVAADDAPVADAPAEDPEPAVADAADDATPEEVAADDAPVADAPVVDDTATVDGADATPEEVAADDAPVADVPVEDAEVVVADGADATAEEVAADDAPAEDPEPVVAHAADDATPEEVAADDAPVADAPAEDAEAVVADGEDATAEEVAADDAPVVDAPAANATPKKVAADNAMNLF